MAISFFGLIFIVIVVIGVGFGALTLLSLLINAFTGRRNPKPATRVGAWSGFTTALGVSALLLVGFIAISTLFYQHAGRSSQRHMAATATARDSGMRDAKKTQAVRLAKAVEEVPVGKAEAINVALAMDDAASRLLESDESSASVDPASVDSVDPRPLDAESPVFAEARKAQLEQLVAGVGQFLRSNWEKIGDKDAVAIFGHAAKSDNGDVVIFQPSEEMVDQILGSAGRELLKSFNSELPGRIRQTYALIPLTPPVGPTVPVKSLLAAGGLEAIANSIVFAAENVSIPQINASLAADDNESKAAGIQAEVDSTLSVAPEIRAIPQWMNEVDGRRVVAKTQPILPGEDADALMAAAINEALAKHVKSLAASMTTSLKYEPKSVRVKLTSAEANKYIVDTYERPETMESEVEGTTTFQIHYALLEFPESVDQVAIRQIRRSIQADRIAGLGVIVGAAWLSICSAGFGFRQWQKGTKLGRIAAAPAFAVVTIPTMLIAVAMVVALAKDEMPRGSWNSQPVTLDLTKLQA